MTTAAKTAKLAKKGVVMESIYKLIMGIALAAVFVACEPINRYLGLQDDNLGEELVEAAIKIESGLDIDLTPSTPEK